MCTSRAEELSCAKPDVVFGVMSREELLQSIFESEGSITTSNVGSWSEYLGSDFLV